MQGRFLIKNLIHAYCKDEYDFVLLIFKEHLGIFLGQFWVAFLHLLVSHFVLFLKRYLKVSHHLVVTFSLAWFET